MYGWMCNGVCVSCLNNCHTTHKQRQQGDGGRVGEQLKFVRTGSSPGASGPDYTHNHPNSTFRKQLGTCPGAKLRSKNILDEMYKIRFETKMIFVAAVADAPPAPAGNSFPANSVVSESGNSVTSTNPGGLYAASSVTPTVINAS